LSKAKLAFIGGGNMTTSLVAGLIKKGYPVNQITVSNPGQEKLIHLNKKFGIHTTTDNSFAAADAEVVVLAVKPQMAKIACQALSASLKHQPLVISIAAGVQSTSLQEWLGKDIPIIRCMPNTPSLVQTGAAGLFANTNVSHPQRKLATEILDAVGMSCWLEKEEDIDIVTAVSGSGPAYFFLFMEAMEKTAVDLGLNQEAAHKLVLQTALGAAKMATEDTIDPAELRRRVTSPGGTTEAAIETFIEGGILGLVNKAMVSAVKRAQAMAKDK